MVISAPKKQRDRPSAVCAGIDARREMQGELCDLFNYADLLDDDVMKVHIQLWCRDIWQELEDMGD